MFQEERWDRIVDHLQHHKRATVEELCELLGISRDTARRDLLKLEDQGRIVRTRGGAMMPSFSKDIDHYEKRVHLDRSVKSEIGKVAASFIKTGDYLLLDSSTTVQHAAEVIPFSGNVVVTNSIDIAGVLAAKDGVSLQLLGGTLHKDQRFIYGPRAISTLSEYRFDKLMLGACGITADGISNPYEEESLLIREMIRVSDKVIVLADRSKFGKRLFHRSSGLEAVDTIITNGEPPEEIRKACEQHQVEIIITNEGRAPDQES